MVRNELKYPNLEFCSIILTSSIGTNSSRHLSSVSSISEECLEAMNKPIPEVYDFSIGKYISATLLSYESLRIYSTSLVVYYSFNCTFESIKSFLTDRFFIFFHRVEKSIIEKHDKLEKDNQSPLLRQPPLIPNRQNKHNSKASKRLSIPQRDLLQRMKSVTNASEDVCLSMLEQNDFDLNASIDAFLN